MIKPEDIPIYEPEFKMRGEYRMSIIWLPHDPRPKGGLAIVWGEGKMTREILIGRRPAVMVLPDIWTRSVRDFWKGGEGTQFPPDKYDQVWHMTCSSMAWSMDDEDDRAMGGDWLPCRQNILVEMMKSKNPQVRAIGADTKTRCFELLAEEDVCYPLWLGKLPMVCKRCGGTGNIGFISSVRCPDC